MSALSPASLVVDGTGARLAVCAVRRDQARWRVVDRVVLLDMEAESFGDRGGDTLPADVAARQAAVAAARARLQARGLRLDGETLWLAPKALGASSARTGDVAVPVGVAIALGAEQLWPQRSETAQASADALHLGFGTLAGMVRTEGRIVLDRDGWPVDPRSLRLHSTETLTAHALGTCDPLDAFSVLATWCRQVPSTAVEPFWPLRSLAYPARRVAAGDKVATTLAFASRRALGLLIAELLSLFDVASVVLHLGEPALASWLGLGDSGDAGWLPLDASALGLLGETVAAHSFASMRAGATLRWQPTDPDAAAIGAVLWANRAADR